MQKNYTIKKLEKSIFQVTSDSGQIYTVDLNPVTCTCPSQKFRNIRTGDFCKHIKAVIQHLEEHKDDINKSEHND